MVLELLVVGLEIGVSLTTEGSALLPELGVVWVPLVLPAVVTLVGRVCFLWPTGRVSSGKAGEVCYCR